ncbi:MAG: hypothetical protein ACI4EO_09880 [Blautia sp.]
MKKKEKILSNFLLIFCIAAFGIGSVTAKEIERACQKFYSAVNCPDVVVETGSVEESEEWMKKQYQNRTVSRLEIYPFYYKEDRKKKVYCMEKRKQGGWKAAFTGYRRLTVKQELWQPVEEIFQETEIFEKNKGKYPISVRYHIWCEEPENFMEKTEVQKWNLKEKYLTGEMPFYTHKQEVKEITVKIVQWFGRGLGITAAVGYLAFLFLRTRRKEKEREVYRKLGGSAKQYRKEVLVRLIKGELFSCAAGILLFFFLHEMCMKTVVDCFGISDYRWNIKICWNTLWQSGWVMGILFPLSYGTVMKASNITDSRWETKIRNILYLLSAGMSAAVFFTAFFLVRNYDAMEKELENRKKYDAVVFFDRFLKDEKVLEVLKQAGAEQVEPVNFIPVRLKGTKTVQTTAVGLRKNTTLWRGTDRAGTEQMPEDDGILMTEYTGKKAGVKEKQKISFLAVYNGKSFEGTAEIKKMINQQTQFQEAFCAEGFEYANAAFVVIEQESADSLYLAEYVEGVLSRGEEEKEYRSRTAGVKKISSILGCFSLLVFLVTWKNMQQETVLKLKKKLRILHVLGCSEKQKMRIALKKFLITLLPGLMAGTIGGIFLADWVLALLSTDSFRFMVLKVEDCFLMSGSFLMAEVLSGIWCMRKHLG